jgi:HK97 family phage major capsid protein
VSETTVKDLMAKAMQCIHLARTISDRYPDPVNMPADDVAKVRLLIQKAQEIRDRAEVIKAQDSMEAWSMAPDQVPAALSTEAAVRADKMGNDGPQFADARKARNVELFAKALRHGWKNQPWFNDLDQVEKAALIEDATGEVIVPHDIAGPIFKTLPRLSVFRGAGPTIRPTSGNKVDLRSMTGVTAGWGKIEVNAGLGGAQSADIVPSTPVDVVEVHDLLAMSRIGVDELADTDVNLVTLFQNIIGQEFAQVEDDAYAAGNGVSKPWGLAARATAAANTITQAVTAGTASTPTGDNLKSLQYRVAARFRINGSYFASADAAESIALLKDTTSNYLWQPSIRAGEPDTLFGKAFYTLEGLPSMAATTAITEPSVIFGDPSAGYLLADRQTITMQRLDERFAELGLVAFIFKMRVGGDVMRPAAFAKYLL